MERKTIITASLIIACIIFIVCFSFCRHKSIVNKPQPIDSLIIVNDSLKVQLDTIDSEIIDLNKWYEQTCSTILNQSTDSDFMFFTDYLNKRFSGGNNSGTTKTN